MADGSRFEDIQGAMMERINAQPGIGSMDLKSRKHAFDSDVSDLLSGDYQCVRKHRLYD